MSFFSSDNIKDDILELLTKNKKSITMAKLPIVFM